MEERVVEGKQRIDPGREVQRVPDRAVIYLLNPERARVQRYRLPLKYQAGGETVLCRTLP
jgi:hypothetical protein